MILKQADDKTADLAGLSALLDLPGLTKRQRDNITAQIHATQAGDRGERDVAYFLNHSMGDSANTLVINDLRLDFHGQTAQIDHLVISRYRFAYVLETKSLNASLQCNEAGEWTAWYGAYKQGTPVQIASPIEQARRHVDVLRRWFQTHGWPMIKRIEPVVVVSPTTRVGKVRAKGDEAVAIVRSDLFRRWWENDRDIGHPVVAPWLMASRFSTAQLAELGTALVADHRPAHRDWAAEFGLTRRTRELWHATTKASPTPDSSRSGRHRAAEPLIEAASAAPYSKPAEARTVETPFGAVILRRVSDGRYALRHEQDERLVEHVGRIGQEHGSWQPRFKNWLVLPTEVEVVAGKLRQPG